MRAIVAAVVGSSLVRVLPVGGAGDHWLAVPVLAVYPWLVLAAGVGALGAGLLAWSRGMAWLRTATAVFTLAAVIGTAVVAPRTIARPQPGAEGPEVTIGMINVRRGLADPQRVAQIVENTGIDVLVVVELTAAIDEQLRRAGLAASLPHAVVAPTRATAGGGVYAATPLEPRQPPSLRGDTPDVVADLPGGAMLQVTTTHPVPPIGPRRTRQWKQGLDLVGAPPRDQDAIVVGDFNATLDHTTFRAVLAGGWRDAAREAGQGLAVTYGGLLGGSPGLPMAIDHVLVSTRIAVRSARTYDVAGTDHRLLVVDLQLPETTG